MSKILRQFKITDRTGATPNSVAEANTVLDIESTTKGVGLPQVTTDTAISRNGSIWYDAVNYVFKGILNSNKVTLATGSDYIFEFKKSGSLSYGLLDTDGGGFTNNMGYVIPYNMTLKDVSIVLGLSEASASETLSFSIRKLAVGVGVTGTETQISLGGGTLVQTVSLASGGALSSLYYRNIVGTGLSVSLNAGDVIWIESSNFAFWTVTDVMVKIRCNG